MVNGAQAGPGADADDLRYHDAATSPSVPVPLNRTTGLVPRWGVPGSVPRFPADGDDPASAPNT
jgi:hypothetical protein